MNKINYIFSCLLIFFLTGCNEELNFVGEVVGQSDSLLLNISYPAPEIIKTRGDDQLEREIQDLNIYIFNSEGTIFYQKFNFLVDQLSTGSVSLILNEKAKDKDLLIYAVANANDKLKT